MRLDSAKARANLALFLAAGLAVATGLTFWFGLRATREWERSTPRPPKPAATKSSPCSASPSNAT